MSTFTKAAVFGLAIIGLAIPAQAINSSNQVRVDVPFEFQVGSEVLPPGEYTLTRSGSHALVVRDEDRQVRATVVSRAQHPSKHPAPEAKITFNKYSDDLFLARIEAPGFGSRDLNKTKAERAAAETAEAAARYTVELKGNVD